MEIKIIIKSGNLMDVIDGFNINRGQVHITLALADALQHSTCSKH